MKVRLRGANILDTAHLQQNTAGRNGTNRLAVCAHTCELVTSKTIWAPWCRTEKLKKRLFQPKICKFITCLKSGVGESVTKNHDFDAGKLHTPIV